MKNTINTYRNYVILDIKLYYNGIHIFRVIINAVFDK